MGQNELSLIAKIVFNNDQKAFGNLIDMYQSEIRGLFFRLTSGDEFLINDLSQEVFIRIYKNLKNFKAKSKLSTWIYRISINVLYDYKKSLKPMLDIPDQDPVYETITIENKIDINSALRILNEKERIAIILHYEKGFSHDQIKTIMRIPIGTVKSNILRGMSKLKKYFSYEE